MIASGLRRVLAGYLLGVSGVSVAAETPEVEPLAVVDGAPSSESLVLGFQDSLFQATPVSLDGMAARRDIGFRFPDSWEATGDGTVHLELEHSPLLLGDRSSLTVLVNNRAVGSVLLDATNAVGGSFSASIPEDMLEPYNELGLVAVQHYIPECEDPFDPALWTRVGLGSRIELSARPRVIDADLAQLPAPFYEESGVGDVAFTLVGPASPTPSELNALAVLGFGLGREADYRGVRIDQVTERVSEATGHAVLVALWDTHPDLTALLGGVTPEPGEGLLALVPNPTDPTQAVLVVTGTTPASLVGAARTVVDPNLRSALSGPTAVIRSALGRPPASKRRPFRVPMSASFSLEDVGVESQTRTGFYADRVMVPLRFEGDAVLKGSSGTMELHYAYGTGLDPEISAIEVVLEGVTLTSQRLTNPEGEQDATLEVILPANLVKPTSNLEIRWKLFPEGYERCERVGDRIIWGTVLNTTRFTLPRSHAAELPDLGRLKYGLWPFTLEGEAGATTVVVPDVPTREDGAAVVHLAAALGRHRDTRDPELDVVRGSDWSGYPDRHAIVLVSGQNSFYDQMTEDRLVMQDVSEERVQRDGAREEVLQATVRDDRPWLEQTLHPAKRERSILVVRSPTSEGLPPLTRRLADGAFLALLDGNIANMVLADPLRVETARLGPTVRVGEASGAEAFKQWASRFGWLILMVLIGFAMFFSLAVSLWAQRSGGRT
ncbi:MAG: cellulose biosynthesis cyclic di-GMP-binding regulatory protein BcsB [Myxococcota bacterium]